VVSYFVPTLRSCIKFSDVQAVTVEMQLSQYSSGLTIIRSDQPVSHAKDIPEVIITDTLKAYLDGIERVFEADTQRVLSRGFRIQPNILLGIEAFGNRRPGKPVFSARAYIKR